MNNARVLLVEDDQTLRSVIAEALVEDGYVVETAADGLRALELVERNRPDLVILDLMMPYMDGEEFSNVMRQNGLTAIPIIVISASRHTEEAGKRIGAEYSLRKPFDLFELTDRVNALLRE